MATRAEIEAIKAQQSEELQKKADAEAGGAEDDNADGGENAAGEQKPQAKKEADHEAELQAELERERERTKKAEEATADEAFKRREAQRKLKESGTGDEGGEEKPLTATQLQEILERDRETTRKELQSEAIKTKAKSLSRNDTEAALIIEIHKNRRFPAGMPLDEQLEEAYAIANRKNLLQQNEELKRAVRGKETATRTSAEETYREGADASEPKMAQQDIQAIKDAGMTWDGNLKLYKKVLNTKRTLFYDPKKKTRWVGK